MLHLANLELVVIGLCRKTMVSTQNGSLYMRVMTCFSAVVSADQASPARFASAVTPPSLWSPLLHASLACLVKNMTYGLVGRLGGKSSLETRMAATTRDHASICATNGTYLVSPELWVCLPFSLAWRETSSSRPASWPSLTEETEAVQWSGMCGA